MSFLANPLALTVAEFQAYVATKHWAHWKPQFIVLHNSAEPNLAQWEHYGLGKSAAVQRARNLNSYYAHQEGWSSGPHLFIAPDLIVVACDLEAYGIHASCFNHVSIGIEMVGDYRPGADPFNAGGGAKVRDNAVAALAILHHALGISPDTLHFHRDCERDHHVCPGLQVDKAAMIARVKAYMGGHPASAPETNLAAELTAAPALIIDGETVSSSQMVVARQIYAFFVGKIVPIQLSKLLPRHAAGFIAQAWGETRLVPWLWGDTHTAYGLFQFHGDRLGASCKALGFTKPTPPIHGQTRGLNDLSVQQYLDVAWHDLTTAELHHLISISQASTAQQAGELACTLWECAGAGGAAERRGKWAEQWLAYLTAHPAA